MVWIIVLSAAAGMFVSAADPRECCAPQHIPFAKRADADEATCRFAHTDTPHNNALPPPQYQQIPPHPSFLRPFIFQRLLHFTPSPGSSGTCEPMGVIPHNMRDLRMFSVPPPLGEQRGSTMLVPRALAAVASIARICWWQCSLALLAACKLVAAVRQYTGEEERTIVSPFDHVESVPSRGGEAERFSALFSEIWSLYAHFHGRFPHGCHLVLVGSSVNGFGLDTSDADMCLIVSNSLIDQRDWAPLILTEVMLVLHTVRGLVYVPAKIPLVKFTNVRTGGVCLAVLPSLRRKLPDQFHGSNCHVLELDMHKELLMKQTENTLSLGDLFARFLDYTLPTGSNTTVTPSLSFIHI
ncbi:unnamed protein product [Notodromas monacha]|uniref:Poly(A) RNA polymerase mitochondrial-like central palm domain-containing protein n=1 Tax=Notodromas monacha TaxID=399045 RepID=A0A7R9BSH7_9CRUS|nr:unnamed protein product [Notodromas monacha]CAG0920888.1 unnamed protein product [Notodromas monacha]